ANILLFLRDLQGNALSTGTFRLATKEHLARFVDQFAPDFILPSSFSSSIGLGTLEVTSDQPISIVALRLTINQRGEVLLTSTPIADLSLPTSSASLNFPQIADGSGVQTTLLFLNTSNTQESGI